MRPQPTRPMFIKPIPTVLTEMIPIETPPIAMTPIGTKPTPIIPRGVIPIDSNLGVSSMSLSFEYVGGDFDLEDKAMEWN